MREQLTAFSCNCFCQVCKLKIALKLIQHDIPAPHTLNSDPIRKRERERKREKKEKKKKRFSLSLANLILIANGIYLFIYLFIFYLFIYLFIDQYFNCQIIHAIQLVSDETFNNYIDNVF